MIGGASSPCACCCKFIPKAGYSVSTFPARCWKAEQFQSSAYSRCFSVLPGRDATIIFSIFVDKNFPISPGPAPNFTAYVLDGRYPFYLMGFHILLNLFVGDDQELRPDVVSLARPFGTNFFGSRSIMFDGWLRLRLRLSGDKVFGSLPDYPGIGEHTYAAANRPVGNQLIFGFGATNSEPTFYDCSISVVYT